MNYESNNMVLIALLGILLDTKLNFFEKVLDL